MTEADVLRIESTLGVLLPTPYRQTLLAYPYPSFAGSDDCTLFDNAESLINLNLQYREGLAGMPRWPKTLLFIGDDGAASTYAIDTTVDSCSVVFLDHGHVDKPLERTELFSDWLDQQSEVYDNLPSESNRRNPIAIALGILAFVIASLLFLSRFL